jgi:hypothetical protein
MDEILALGGTAVICSEDEDVRAKILELTDGAGVTKALDCVYQRRRLMGKWAGRVADCYLPAGDLGLVLRASSREPRSLLGRSALSSRRNSVR